MAACSRLRGYLAAHLPNCGPRFAITIVWPTGVPEGLSVHATARVAQSGYTWITD
ncbi:MAG: hypothetical protein ACK515_24530 [bacterium]